MIDLATIAFRKPWLVGEQIRLLLKYLNDDFRLTVFDNTPDEATRDLIYAECDDAEVIYLPVNSVGHEHCDALNAASDYLLDGGNDYIGFMDHDIFPVRPTSLISLIDKAGFYGIGQRHSPTDSLYLWPGFAFFSRAWLDSKAPLTLNFDGIRGATKADDSDTGGMNAPLFADEDWRNLYGVASHGYEAIRAPDDYGLQSWGIERFSDWIHLTNGSNWKPDVPDFEGRERLTLEMLAAL